MKRLELCLLAVLLLGVSGCQKEEPTKKQDVQEEKQDENTDENTAFTNQYGSIDTIVGNEITVKLAKNPFSEGDVGEEGSDGEMVAAVLVSSSEAGKDEGNTGANERIELEYLDESADFVIPAGVKIYSSNGKELTVKDLVKGDTVQVVQDNQGNIVNITKYE